MREHIRPRKGAPSCIVVAFGPRFCFVFCCFPLEHKHNSPERCPRHNYIAQPSSRFRFKHRHFMERLLMRIWVRDMRFVGWNLWMHQLQPGSLMGCCCEKDFGVNGSNVAAWVRCEMWKQKWVGLVGARSYNIFIGVQYGQHKCWMYLCI